MKRKLISLLLVFTMLAAMFMGCGKSETVQDAGENTNTGTDVENDIDTDQDDEEMSEIVVGWMSFAPLDEKQTAAVVEAVNAITEKEINTHVDIQFYAPDTYATQIPMMIQANEKLDLMMYTPVPGASYDSFKGQNQLMDISGYLDTFGKDIKDNLGDLLKATTTKDGIFGAPAYRLMAGDLYIVMRKDVLDDLGLTEKAQNMTTWTEYREILEEVVAKTDLAGVANCDADGSVLAVSPYYLGSDSFAENRAFDTLGDSYYLIAVDEETDTVESYYFSEEYEKAVARAHEWYKAGLIYKDAATSQDMGDTLIKNNVAFSTIETGELGVETTKGTATGHEVLCKKITEAIISTQACFKFGFAVPVTATEPKAAVKFLNLLYSNADLLNTMAWGVEGRDWVNKNGEAAYPDGVTAETVAYHTADFLNGNQFLVLPWEGDGADFREIQKSLQDSAPISKYMGFSFDHTGLENELTACFNIGEQYRNGLNSGSVDYKTVLPEFREKLKAAGIDKIIEAYQEQLNAWLGK